MSGKPTKTTQKTTETPNNIKSWEVRNITNAKGEILIYGDIEEYRYLENDVTAFTFAQDLRDLGNVSDIDIRINSAGGSVYAGQAIYAQLKAHPATINVYIDGIAASISSFIAMAGDHIYASRSSQVMIHNPAVLAFGEVSDLEKSIDMLNKVKDSIIAAYMDKTGHSYEVLSAMMDEETWMTGQEAVETGFADSLNDEIQIVASASGKNLVVNGIEHNLSKYSTKPDITEVNNAQFQKQLQDNLAVENKNSEKEEPSLKSLDELKNQYPDLYKEAFNAGAASENSRMKAIDELPFKGHEDLVNKTKYETKNSAGDLSIEILKVQNAAGATYLQNREEDATQANEVPGDSTPQNNGSLSEDEERKTKATNLAEIMNKKRGGK
ncbi:head maturation protease, ClpP-related [Jeotgalibacillus terrae]|nr:head maturation protease, ClpP-related [Jeotgalibacillus terrae]